MMPQRRLGGVRNTRDAISELDFRLGDEMGSWTSEDSANRAERDWVAVARWVLASIAALHKTTTYGELYDILGPRFGWPERTSGQWWTPNVKHTLAELGKLNRQYNDPALSCLVRTKVRTNPGPIGEGYKTAVMNRYGVALTDLDEIQAHAEAETAKCYEHFGTADAAAQDL